MTEDRKQVMMKILGRCLSHEIDMQNEWRKKDYETFEFNEEGMKEVDERRDWLIGIINEYMSENGLKYDPLAYIDYE